MQISKIPGAGTYPGNAPEACSNTLYSRFFKRLLDILMAFIGLVLFMQVFLIIAIAIKLDTAGPVLFVQPRLGKRGEMFRIIKFRTMVVGAEKMDTGLIINDCTDRRITRVGRFLRKTSLDELPQLLNILWGNMSVVGPRPPAVYWPYDGIDNYPDWAKKRFWVKPGLTGLAQVVYRNNAAWEERFELDNRYVDNISLMLDIKLILKTLVLIFKRENIY